MQLKRFDRLTTLASRGTFDACELDLSATPRLNPNTQRILVTDIGSVELEPVLGGTDNISTSGNRQLELTLFVCRGRVTARLPCGLNLDSGYGN